ncbi:hypothetical protein NP493_465g01006 [Ridgeia piscesae]|uniref:Uncharacterized protein n=1 Tax=Ridgeia piscesae TaxID=27915 RepID=A0AAD9KYW3_RIDPI|nr:hypothetical protein NP493_465g01006 [Ridgeia piscesae]
MEPSVSTAVIGQIIFSGSADVYKKKSAECLRSVSEHNLNIYSDFFFHTFMQHFKLYQFVYLNERQCNVNKIHLEVATPPKQDSFTEAKPVMVWEYNKTVEDIKEEVAHRKLEHEQNIENTLKEDEERKMMMALNLNNISVPMNREDILQMIQDVATVNITHTSHQLEASIATLLDDFDMMFEPTAVPRPAVMGPPPRFDMKSTPKSSPTPSRGRSPSLGQKARRSPKDKGFNSK